MMFTRDNQPPARPAKLHVRAVRSNFEIREEAPAPPKFIRRAPVPEPGCPISANRAGEPEEPFLNPPTKAQMMARR